MADKDVLQVVANSLGTISSVTQQFFNRLTSGFISQARETFPSIGSSIGVLNLSLIKFRDVLQKHNVIADLISVKNSFYNSYSTLKTKFDAEAGLTKEQYAQDPATYKVLLTDEFKPVVDQIVNTANTEKAKIESLFQAESAEMFKPFLDIDADKIKRTKKYLSACASYAGWNAQIKSTEEQIMTSTVYDKKLHEKIIYGKNCKGYLHARITDNLRLMYLYYREEKRIVFDNIVTKNDLDKDKC